MSKEQQRTGAEVLEHIRELRDAPLKSAHKEWLKLFPLQLVIALGFLAGGTVILYWSAFAKVGQLALLLFISAGFWLWPTEMVKSRFYYIALHIIMLMATFVMWGGQ